MKSEQEELRKDFRVIQEGMKNKLSKEIKFRQEKFKGIESVKCVLEDRLSTMERKIIDLEDEFSKVKEKINSYENEIVKMKESF